MEEDVEPTGVFVISRNRPHVQVLSLDLVFSIHYTQQTITPTVKSVLHVNLNIDGTPITSKTHTHPSHSLKSR
jgi:hypothetical protein